MLHLTNYSNMPTQIRVTEMVKRAHKELLGRFRQHKYDPSIQELRQSYLETINMLPKAADTLQFQKATMNKMNAYIRKAITPKICSAPKLIGGGLERRMSDRVGLKADSHADRERRYSDTDRAHGSERDEYDEMLVRLRLNPDSQEVYQVQHNIREAKRMSKEYLLYNRKMVMIVSMNVLCDVTEDEAAMHITNTIKNEDLWIKLRPTVQTFLREMADIYDIFLITSLPLPDAELCLELLDKQEKFFNNRLIATDAFFNMGSKDEALKYFPPEIRPYVIIVDTNESVWKSKDILLVKPYDVFASEEKAFKGNCKVSCLRTRQDICFKIGDDDEDHWLYNVGGYLKYVHKGYFTPEAPGAPLHKFNDDVGKRALKEVRREAINSIRNYEHIKSKVDITLPPTTEQTIQKIRQISALQLYRKKKLILLVDLDNTVINATSDRLAGYLHPKATQILFDNTVVKVRPYAVHFLQAMSVLCEMVVVTMGTEKYAARIVELLDPMHKIFKNRIFSRNNMDEDVFKDEVIDYFKPEVRDMIVIVDDKREAWPQTPKVIPIDYYRVFDCFNRAFSRQYIEELPEWDENNGYPMPEDMQKQRQVFSQIKERIKVLHKVCFGTPPKWHKFNPSKVREQLEYWVRVDFRLHTRDKLGTTYRPYARSTDE